MESVKEKSAEVRGFKGSISARDELGAIGTVKEPAEGLPEMGKGAFDILEDGKLAEPKANPKIKPKGKAKKAEPKAAKAKPKIAKAKISVAIDPADLERLRKAAKKADKSVSLFAAECIAERVR